MPIQLDIRVRKLIKKNEYLLVEFAGQSLDHQPTADLLVAVPLVGPPAAEDLLEASLNLWLDEQHYYAAIASAVGGAAANLLHHLVEDLRSAFGQAFLYAFPFGGNPSRLFCQRFYGVSTTNSRAIENSI